MLGFRLEQLLVKFTIGLLRKARLMSFLLVRTCVTVGAGGHFSGGSYSNIMRKYGLSVDNILDAQLVDNIFIGYKLGLDLRALRVVISFNNIESSSSSLSMDIGLRPNHVNHCVLFLFDLFFVMICTTLNYIIHPK